MSSRTNLALAPSWTQLWNGDRAVADRIVSDDFVTHLAPFTGGGTQEMRGREALKAWIADMHRAFADLRFTIDVGPISDDDHLVIRWGARGVYAGGFPGTSASAIGKEVSFTGTDILRVSDGNVVEYWVNADGLDLCAQLGITELASGGESRE